MTTSPSRIVRQLLELPLRTAFDVDEEGRVLAGSDEQGSQQLVEIAPDGTRTPLTDLPSPCSGRYVPGRRAVVVCHDRGGDERMQLSLLEDVDALTAPAGLADLTPLVHDSEHMHNLQDVTPDALVYSTNRRNGVDMDVVVRDLGTGDERVVYAEGGYVVGSVISHDLTRVAVTRLTRQPNSTAVSVSGHEGTRDATDPDVHAHTQALGFTADDSALLLESNQAREFAAILRLKGEDWQPLVEDDGHDLTAWPARDGTAMVVGTNVDGAWHLAVHEEDGHLRCPVDVPDDGVPEVVWSTDGRRLVVATSRPGDPGSVWLVDAATGAASMLLDGRADLPTGLGAFSEPEIRRYPTPDGEEVPCFVHRPLPGGLPELEGASVVVVHGGPESQATRRFGSMTQALCSLGLTVLVPNVRGSTGYGKRWYSLDDVELRLDSVADLAALHDWLPELGLDAGRSALWGGSYGGYMVLAGLTMQPERWACGVDVVGISSLTTFLENTSAYRREAREREYGFLDRHREFLEQASPLTHLEKLRAPLVVIHGANDPRVPLSEAEQIRDALDARGIECLMKVYDDEGHGLARRPNRIDAYTAAVDFVVRHLGADR